VNGKPTVATGGSCLATRYSPLLDDAAVDAIGRQVARLVVEPEAAHSGSICSKSSD